MNNTNTANTFPSDLIHVVLTDNNGQQHGIFYSPSQYQYYSENTISQASSREVSPAQSPAQSPAPSPFSSPRASKRKIQRSLNANAKEYNPTKKNEL